ncbi:MAG: hypothetical protein ABIP82_06625, partial [Nitrospirales bacterium]
GDLLGACDSLIREVRQAASLLKTPSIPVQVRPDDEGSILWAFSKAEAPENFELLPVDYSKTTESYISSTIDSGVARLIGRELADSPPPGDWNHVVNAKHMAEVLGELKNIVTQEGMLEKHPEIQEYMQVFLGTSKSVTSLQLKQFFEKESKIAGYLVFLAQHSPGTLADLFYRTPKTAVLHDAGLVDPLLSFGANNYDAILSPIGIIHLYRQYFFEFDSFLGPPVGHIWLSPGGTVEVIEVSTRKVFTEQSYESMTETSEKTETEVVDKEEIADAVKDENRNDVKLGFSNTASYNAPVFQDTATASMSLDNASIDSREKTTTKMRQQSEKLSSEIKRNFKTTFRTSTEVTDTTSKRYVLQNTTKHLVNYELRRKMRKVGVEVQDIGVQLCWHTFVDDPVRTLGIAELVHIAAPADLNGVKEPDAPIMPEAEVRDKPIAVRDIVFSIQEGRMAPAGIFWALTPPFQLTPPKPGYIYSRTDVVLTGEGAFHTLRAYPENTHEAINYGASKAPDVAMIPTGDPTHPTEPSVRSIVLGILLESDFSQTVADQHWYWHVDMTVIWKPSQLHLQEITATYQKAMVNFTAVKERAFREALVTASRDRIKLASKITARPTEVLREEERTVIYRQLLTQLMSVGTDQSKHVVSELIRSIFDVDKMLYFVAPEWWVPRLHGTQQHLKKGPAPGSPGKHGPMISRDYIVDWGGGEEKGRLNYYITEDSAPAKLGSSLGWLLQLDGDNLRNTILNSPWVKAVIPIRIGKERAAINWLQQANVEGSDGLDAAYAASSDDPQELQSTSTHTVTVREALNNLIGEIQEFDRIARTPAVPNPAEPGDFSNHIAGSMPTEGVFERGFYPLQGGVRFNQKGTEQAIISQWTEILPTDQVAALEVKYDPKTLQIITAVDLEVKEEDDNVEGNEEDDE